MRKRVASAIVGLVVVGGYCQAQTPAPSGAVQRPVPGSVVVAQETPPAAPAANAAEAPMVPLAPFVVGNTAGPRLWVSGEYLMWWIKGAPLPLPLLTTTTAPGLPPPGTFGPASGALGSPGTQVLYGGHDADFGMFNGMRWSAGGWLDAEQRFGVEAQIFNLESRHSGARASSDGTGNPPLYMPDFDSRVGLESALIVADPVAQFGGNVSIISQSRLWGANVGGIVNLRRASNTSLDFLYGYRYLNLSESLQIDNTTTDLVLGTVATLQDRFATNNQFNGAQFGARYSVATGRLSTAAGKMAFGSTHEIASIGGFINQGGPFAFPAGTFPGGFYAQPTSIGTRSADQFAVVPELQLKLGYRFREHLSGFIGYDFLYWSGVARPGDQMDRNLNLSQNPVLSPQFNGVLTGPANPSPQFNRTDFWAHGLSFGLNLGF